jgi:hypothetical protein
MTICRIFLVVALVGCGALGLSAHHSLTATYDTGNLVPLSGVISRVEVMNPHVKVALDSRDAGGSVTTWTIEMAAPNALVRRSVDMQLLKAGQPVTIEAWLRRDGTKEATGRTLVTADGKRVDIGDSLNWT